MNSKKDWRRSNPRRLKFEHDPTAKIHRTRVHINIHRYMCDVWLSLYAFPVLSIHSNGFTEITFCIGVTGVTYAKMKIPILSAEIILLFPKIIVSNMLSLSVLRKSDFLFCFILTTGHMRWQSIGWCSSKQRIIKCN